MKIVRTLGLLSIALVISAPAAFAFEKDDQSMGSAASSANFSDPDEKTPVTMHMNMNGSSKNMDNTDPTAIHYIYDTSSGVYVPSTAKQ